ncbi:MAG: uroporphyrinogen decarboxylase [Chloroflexi bacterium]|nr:uroporphyrinogen decarboxylase [Chloroflexota bacterium]
MSDRQRHNGRELLLAALAHEPVPTVPWVPFAGVHAGKLTGMDATTVLTDANALVASLLQVNALYDPDGQPVVFDLQLEAEILGCELAWANKAPPSVATHPFSNTKALPDALPERHQGRLPIVLEAMARMKAAVGDRTALYGLICGPLTLASHLRGTELFMDMFDDPDYVAALLAYTTRVNERMAELYVEAGMDVIGCVDPLVSQVSPRTFRSFLDAPLRSLFGGLRERGVLSSLFVCGDATKNIEVMCQTAPDAIYIDENIDLVMAKRITDEHNITIGGNIPLTTVMLLGSQQDNIKWVVDTLEAVDPHNYILAPGCDMPYDCPIDNVIGVAQAVRDPERFRAVVAHYQAPEIDYQIEIPDYASLRKPLMEVFTLDSDTCAACSYMLSAAQRAVSEMAGQVDMVEYKITVPENIARMKKMGISNLPCILVDGVVAFSSIIPGNRELLSLLGHAISRRRG